MNLGVFQPYADDLAPGDRDVLDAAWDSFSIERVRSAAGPAFDEGWSRLWAEFGDRGEMERREVIEDRLAWDPRRPVNGHALLYEMTIVRHRGQFVAVRDHTAILTPAALAGTSRAGVVVHLSHVLVEPSMRGRGLACWLRAMPVATARRCVEFARAGRAGAPLPVTLVAEMEHDDGVTPAVLARLRSYARAGYRVVDPTVVAYCQPDFRSPAEIDRTSVQAVPLCLVLRRVGREHQEHISGDELREIVSALQEMFGVHVRHDHMAAIREATDAVPSGSEPVALLVPASAVGAHGSERACR